MLCPQLAGLFEAGQCMQNMKLRLRLTIKESLQFANKWNNMDSWGLDNTINKKELNK